MTNEEKKAIEYIKYKIENKLPLYEETYVDGKPYRRKILQLETNFTEKQANEMQIILDLVEKQEKVIELYRKLKEDYKRLDELVKTYNAIPNDYMSNDVKIIIADREFFNNGILKENLIPKSKIKEKIKELERIKYTALTERTVEMMNDKINILQLILEESEE